MAASPILLNAIGSATLILLTPSAETFRRRAQITAGIRRYPEHLGFIEIETPVLQAEAGGADALHHISQYLRNGLYLRLPQNSI